MTTFLNPPDIHPPIGAYSHTVLLLGEAQLVFISGQIGMRPDGFIPSTFAEQAELVFQNIRSCLLAHGLDMEAIVKLTAFLLPGQDVQVMREIRQRHFGTHQPASTSVYVPQLVNPAFLLEIEAIAVKPLPPGASANGAA